jgi:hypothetical protein
MHDVMDKHLQRRPQVFIWAHAFSRRLRLTGWGVRNS